MTLPSHLKALLADVRSCRVCERHLPLGPRPILRVASTATLLIVGQAPGTKVHETGVPWNDPSGDRLRSWMAIDRERFYDASRIAIIPTGLCYPGRHERGGDLPPRPECAPLWHPALLQHLPHLELILLIGQYAQAFYLGSQRHATLTETVRAWQTYGPRYLPLPHPSPRNLAWLKRHPWFERDVIPYVRRRVRTALRRTATVQPVELCTG